MLKNRLVVSLATGLVALLASLTVLTACNPAQPSLSASVQDGATNVSLTPDLKVKAQGAVLQQALLERIDPPGERVELSVNEAEARLAARLEPDASYRLSVTAQAQEPTPLPWGERAMTMLRLERIFSTVHSPALVGTGPFTALLGKPIELRFSEPIARAEVHALGHAADAQIAREDPRLLRVQLKDPVPGQDVILRLVDVVGVNGAPADEYRLSVHTPEAVGLVSIGNATAPGRIQQAPDKPVIVQWDRAVTAFTYTVDGETKSWRGEPNHTIRLPVNSVHNRTIQLTLNEALAEDGGWLAAPLAFELVSPPPLKIAAVWPDNGATNVSVNGDPTIRFTEPVALADQAIAEAAIVFDPPVAGRFQWLARDRVRFIPEEGFPRLTDMTLTVRGGSDGVRAETGGVLEENYVLAFQTGRKKVIDVSLGRQILTLLEDDEPVFTALVGTGVRGADTPQGTFYVQGKVPRARFRGVNVDGSRYDIPNVNWVMPFLGDYAIHGAHWRGNFGRAASNGCVSMTDANAKVVYDWADEGTPVVIHR